MRKETRAPTPAVLVEDDCQKHKREQCKPGATQLDDWAYRDFLEGNVGLQKNAAQLSGRRLLSAPKLPRFGLSRQRRQGRLTVLEFNLDLLSLAG